MKMLPSEDCSHLKLIYFYYPLAPFGNLNLFSNSEIQKLMHFLWHIGERYWAIKGLFLLFCRQLIFFEDYILCIFFRRRQRPFKRVTMQTWRIKIPLEDKKTLKCEWRSLFLWFTDIHTNSSSCEQEQQVKENIF
jgi:hypothetical protein